MIHCKQEMGELYVEKCISLFIYKIRFMISAQRHVCFLCE